MSIWQKDVLEFIPGWSKRPLQLKEISLLCRKLSFMLDAGISVRHAVDMLSKQSRGRTKTAVSTVFICVTRGDSLSSALTSAQVFPKLLYGLTEMGEATGRLSEVITQAADYYDRRVETKNELAGAAAYPALVSLLMLAVMVMAVTFVLPSYARVFSASNVDLPFLTRVLLELSDILAKRWAVISITLFPSVFITTIYFKKAGRGTVHRLLLVSPLYRKFINTQLSQALALTLASGQNLTEALPMCIEIMDNIVVKRDLTLVLIDVSVGLPFHTALERVKYIDILFTDMARVGEETGKLPQTMFKCQIYFERTFSLGIKRLNKLIEPTLTIILGVLLGALMLAVILPTFKLADVGW